MPDPLFLSPRRLYGRRSGHRLRKTRQQVLDQFFPQIAVDLPPSGPVILESLYSSPRKEYWFEIGFGNGEHMVELAKAYPGVGILGCEAFINGVSAASLSIESAGITNIKLYNGDARNLLERLPDHCLDRIYLLFPDPWPKRRHHRRRFVNPENLNLLAQKLAPCGEFFVATDHGALARWMLEKTLAHGAFEWLAEKPDDWRCRDVHEPPTRYEMKAKARGAACFYFRFRRQRI